MDICPSSNIRSHQTISHRHTLHTIPFHLRHSSDPRGELSLGSSAVHFVLLLFPYGAYCCRIYSPENAFDSELIVMRVIKLSSDIN